MPASYDFSGVRVLIVGDLILDHYVYGSTERTSPEAPVPVVLYREEKMIPGGAANVARNICAAGAQAICVGIMGDDTEGRALVDGLSGIGADCGGVLAVAERPTTTKIRIISQNQQMVRLDREDNSAISSAAQEKVIAACRAALPDSQAVIISDYGKGVLTPSVLRAVIDAADSHGIPSFVDPKGRDYSKYRGVHALTPNAREAYEASGISTSTLDGLRDAAQAIIAQTGCELLAITRGGEGVALFHETREPLLIGAAAREVFDVTGAGDTFVAFLALGIAEGCTPSEAARLANAAAGVVVGKSGAATVSPAELRAAMSPGAAGRKIRTREELREIAEQLRSKGKKVVFTNGCFDFIHAGHVAFLQSARALGDALILATNTDETITRLKGEPRPIIKQQQRESLLAAIEAVDYIVTFSDPTPHELIRELRPDIVVKGSNYAREQVEGWEIVEGYGGRIELLDLLEDISTHELLAQRKPK